jgi:cytochrome c553
LLRRLRIQPLHRLPHLPSVNPAQKSFSINMGMGKSIATFRAEAKKCVLVCANCHGEIEAGVIKSPPAGAKYRPGRKAKAA